MKIKFTLPNSSLSILRCILCFKTIFRKWGIDTQALETLLRTKLTIDLRKPLNPFVSTQARSKPSKKNSNWVQTLIFTLFGAVYLSLFISVQSKNLGFLIFFGGLMSTVLLSNIMEFSNILVDEKDTYVVFPKPVDDKTLLFSRYIHMYIYVLKLALTFSLPIIIYSTFTIHPLSGFLVFIQVIWFSALLVLFNCIAYLLIFKVTSPKKVKELLAKGQIVVSILFISQFYAIPYFIKATDYIHTFKLSEKPALALIPSTWISVWQDLLIFHHNDLFTISTVLIGFFIGITSFIIFIKYLSPKFNERITALSFSSGNNETTEAPKIEKTQHEKSKRFSYRISEWLTPNDVEKSSFRIIWALTDRFNEFKMRFYPSFGFLIVYFAFLFFQIEGDFNQKLAVLQEKSIAPLFVIYYCGIILNGAFGQLSISAKYKASWIYHMAPVSEAGQILSGSYKAVMVKYLIPIYFIFSIIGVYIFGYAIINDFLLGFIMLNVIAIITNLFLYNTLPFSAPADYYKSKWYMGFVLLFIQAIVCGIHYLIFRWEYVVWGAIPVMSIALFFMFKSYKKQAWEDIKIYEGS